MTFIKIVATLAVVSMAMFVRTAPIGYRQNKDSAVTLDRRDAGWCLDMNKCADPMIIENERRDAGWCLDMSKCADPMSSFHAKLRDTIGHLMEVIEDGKEVREVASPDGTEKKRRDASWCLDMNKGADPLSSPNLRRDTTETADIITNDQQDDYLQQNDMA